MAVPASVPRGEIGFDFLSLAQSVHFFNVMAYDLHGIWDDPRIIGAHSDIAGIGTAIDYILNNSSVPASQVVLGLPAYGRSFTLSDDTCLTLGCPFKKNSNVTAIGKCFLSWYTKSMQIMCTDTALLQLYFLTFSGGCLDTKGFVPFVELYEWEARGKGKGYDSVSVDTDTYTAVMVKDDDQLISYDNAETFRTKVEFATSRCLGGTMVWAIDMLPQGTQSAGRGGASGGGGGGGGAEEGGDGDAQSILTGEESTLAFCGKDWEDAISSCNRPCPSGISDECEEGEMCFAGTTCGAGGGAIAGGNTCKICPDPTSQGVLSWVEIEVDMDGTLTTIKCGDLDYGLLLSVKTDSEVCDSLKLEFGGLCCYTHPENQCTLCTKDQVNYNIRSDLNVTTPDGTVANCGLVDNMLGPEEINAEKCVTTQDALFDACCYNQCTLCDGQGLKWWVDFELPMEGRETQEGAGEERQDIDAEEAENSNEEQEEASKEPTAAPSAPSMTCSSIDASLYSDYFEAETDECLEIRNLYSTDCCYTFPTNACSICKQGDDDAQTLLWAEEVSYEGRNVSCGVIDNILNTEEDGSPTCVSAKETYFDSCCFDKCTLCDEAQLAWDFTIEDSDNTMKTCGDIEATFAANEMRSTSEECHSIKAEYKDICCFVPPISPCDLCPESVRWDETIEFEGVKSTCKKAADTLRREENTTLTCSTARMVCFIFV